MKKHSQKGFTLVELVVVAGIIALLASFILSQLDVSRAKGRDTKKISELKSLQTALELYQLDTGSYPLPSVQPAINNATGLSTMSTTLQPVVNAGFISSIAVPPAGSTIPGGDRYYYQTAPTGTADPVCSGRSLGPDIPYIIYFYTEKPHNLPKLSLQNSGGPLLPQTNGYCLAL